MRAWVWPMLLGYKHEYLQSDWLNGMKTRLLTQHNKENSQLPPDPISHERLGSGVIPSRTAGSGPEDEVTLVYILISV